MINVRIELIARPGKQRELMQSICALRNKIAAEDGCIACTVYQNPDDLDDFVIFEQWEDELPARAHIASENLAVVAGAGAVLSRKVSVSLSKDQAIMAMEQQYRKRFSKETLGNTESKNT